MLSRAVLPLLRPRAVPISIRASSFTYSPAHLRYFANNSGKAPGAPSSNFKASTTPPSHSSSAVPPKQGQVSEIRPESESSGESQKRTAPDAVDSGAGAGTPRSGSSDPQSDFSNGQPEFETAAASPKVESQKPLPDLTRGIPSTIAKEFEARSKHRGPTSLNLTEEDTEGGAGGDVPKNPYVSSTERRRNRLISIVYALFLGSCVGGTIFLGRDWDTEEEEKLHKDAPSGWGFGLFFARIKARFSDITSYYKDPAFEKLLPDDDPLMRQPYTLVISLEDLLVHSEWTREHGYRVAKRPGVDYFLRYLNQYYDMMADQVHRKLDPFRIIRWGLFREATKYEDGEHVKDLSYLNRDLSKVIMIDTHAPHAKRQPENAIILDKWKGDPRDKELVALIPFLEYVASMGVEDVRPVIKSFKDTNIPLEFARREKLMREKFEKELGEERARKPKYSVSSIASLLGIKPTPPTTDGVDPAAGLEQGKMLWDQIRERGQRNYALIEKEIRENGDKWLAELAAEEEKAREEQMNGMRNSFTGLFGFGGNDQTKK
ncbi:import inner membrane translocase subunit tim-50 [Histoplasma capsulatum G186AR]|uniref:Mitochondrial import inner membrane translocase subunit TIM50 n=1 Tax=Ajellomyces capsulatus (strain G186AR / H82 / ATCC MYA-2454 / RMSCC 2432) TaxID=447093 RepID=C0NBF1_AJECG|nr:import inner membrane translocase subunit tim-50 [Histoplasma capsulatum G186AR]EEH10992.1 import inner membrane translocase subunit tim-50 [Histoplasma capsulatum G186AR]